MNNLKSQWKKFTAFTVLSGCQALPVTSDNLCLYIQFLSRSLSSPQSIRNYVSGLKTLHELLNLPFPSYSEISVRLTFKGLDRSVSHIPHRAQPITVKLLLQIHALLDPNDIVHMVIWTLFLFLFFLFSRKCQFIPSSLTPPSLSKLVTRQDVVLKNGMLQVCFYCTKTRQSGGSPLVIPLSPIPGSPLCPVTAYFTMVKLVPAPPTAPLFLVPSPSGPKPILYRYFHHILRAFISAVGLQPSQFSSHSFRRGGATFAFSLGLPGELIQVQGDWRSDAYKLYLETDISDRIKVAKCMASSVSRIS